MGDYNGHCDWTVSLCDFWCLCELLDNGGEDISPNSWCILLYWQFDGLVRVTTNIVYVYKTTYINFVNYIEGVILPLLMILLLGYRLYDLVLLVDIMFLLLILLVGMNTLLLFYLVIEVCVVLKLMFI